MDSPAVVGRSCVQREFEDQNWLKSRSGMLQPPVFEYGIFSIKLRLHTYAGAKVGFKTSKHFRFCISPAAYVF